jgi:hypothetical protein
MATSSTIRSRVYQRYRAAIGGSRTPIVRLRFDVGYSMGLALTVPTLKSLIDES